jgi:transposase-like protein
MDFREATDGLCGKVDHEDVARALGVSLQTIRQARLQAQTKSHRSPPPGWRDAIVRLAEEKVGHYQRLIAELRTNDNR